MDEFSGRIDLAPRGVYWARYTRHGFPIAYALDSNANQIRRLIVKYRSPQDAVDFLWNYLEAVDPASQIRRVRSVLELPSSERPAHLEVLDPYLLPMPGTYARPEHSVKHGDGPFRVIR